MRKEKLKHTQIFAYFQKKKHGKDNSETNENG